MRKGLIVLLVLLLVAGLIACAAQTTPQAATQDGTTASRDDSPAEDTPSPAGQDEPADTPAGTPTDVPTGTTHDVPADTDAPVTPQGGDGAQQTGDVPPVLPTIVGLKAHCGTPQTCGALLQKETIEVVLTYSDGSNETVRDYELASPYASYRAETASTEVRCVRQGVTYACTMTYPIAQRQSSAPNTLYFTDTASWGAVNAYVWNDATKAAPKAWPGEGCTYVGANQYGQGVWRCDAPVGYDRIIFNDGNGHQTPDLVLNEVSRGYYADGSDTAGTYVYDVTDYGRVETLTLSTPLMAGMRQKNVYVYTPAGYDPARTYRVVVAFDGQNMFAQAADRPTGAPQSWAADVALTAWGRDCILVGIDNGSGARRDSELTMSLDFGDLTPLGTADQGTFDQGCLDVLGDWIRDTLLPYVRDRYSVSTARQDCILVGSSSGGLAAFYLGLRDRDVYGAVCALSPATGLFWVEAWQAFLRQTDNSLPQYMYLYCGYGGTDWLENLLYDAHGNTDDATAARIATANILDGLLQGCGYTDNSLVRTWFNAGGKHNEAYWRLALCEFLAGM